jgi:hypothetical protein
MPLPNPTSLVAATAALTLTDSLLGVQTLNRIIPAINFKALNVQYQGFLNIPIASNYNFGPLLPVTLWAVAYVRNLGGQGAGNTTVTFNPSPGAGGVNVVNLDIGAMILYVSPSLSSAVVQTISPGLISVGLVSGATTSSNLEVLLAG